MDPYSTLHHNRLHTNFYHSKTSAYHIVNKLNHWSIFYNLTYMPNTCHYYSKIILINILEDKRFLQFM